MTNSVHGFPQANDKKDEEDGEVDTEATGDEPAE